MNEEKRFERLIIEMRHRKLSEKERSELNDLLRESPDLLDLYLDHCDMEGWLVSGGSRFPLEVLVTDRTLPKAPPSPAQLQTDSKTPSRRQRRVWMAIPAVAAVVVAASMIANGFRDPDGSIVSEAVAGDGSQANLAPAMTDARQAHYERTVANLPTTASQQRPPTSFENVRASISGEVDFNHDIRPILTNNCIACHGPDENSREADLRLDTFAGATGGDYPAIIPGDSANSEVMHRILTDDPIDIMPPPKSHKKLTTEEKALLASWIDQGAEYREHWAFLPPEDAAPEGESVHPVDYFVDRRLQQEGLEKSAEADRHTLLRRLSLDLTGLPPTPEMIESFVGDDSPDAYDRMVSHYLSSPAFGEHAARYWLDAARYGDTHGLHLDNYREIWPYRDWVINAFNDNMPFDQFTIEQLAGDLLPEPTQSQRVATGFNRCNVTTSEGGAIEEEFLMRYAVDRVSTTSTVWMGLTAECAQCHDHKFDPLTMREFYQLYAFFNNTTQRGMDGNIKDTPPVIRVYPDEATEAKAKKLTAEIGDLKKEWNQAKQAEKASFDLWMGSLSSESLDVFPFPGKLEGAPLENQKADPLKVSDLKSPGKNDRFTISFRYVLPQSGSSILFDNTDPDQENRGIRIRVEQGRIYVELIESWPNRMLRTGAARAFKPGSHGHFSVTYDGSGSAQGIRMYSNGDWISSRYATLWEDTLIEDFSSNATARIGGISPENALHTRISEFHFFSDSLPEESIKSLAMYSHAMQVLKKPVDKRSDKDLAPLTDYYHSLVSEVGSRKLMELESARVQLRHLEAKAPTTLVMHEKEGEAKAHILARGEYDQKTEEVSAGFPSFIKLESDESSLPANRLGLARWLTNPDHPLTSRVVVNRIWQQLFGRGIVRTSEDFGTQGELPSHPEVLDHLAIRFVETGWDVKELYRYLVTSKTYRQSSDATPELIERDPDNLLLARGPRFRLDAEAIRDQALQASGLLDRTIGGPSVKPYQPAGLWKTVGYTNSNTQTFLQDYGASPEHRRSLYSFWKRTSPPPNLNIFDAPDRESCTVRRERTNTPLQALVMMNDPQFLRTARFLALEVVEKSDDPDERLDLVALRLVGRTLDPGEKQILTNSMTKFRDTYQSNLEAATQLLVDESNPAFSLHQKSGIDPGELASWTMVASQVMNLDESLTKN